MNPSVIMATVKDAEEKEDEVTRFLSAVHHRLTVLLARSQNFPSNQHKAEYILENLIADRCHTRTGKN